MEEEHEKESDIMPAKLTATKLKSVMKSLPGKVLLECNRVGDLDLYLEKEGNYIFLGCIYFKTGDLSLMKCPTCALDLEDSGDGVRLKCPSCKNVYS